jgi:hypothetical protein
VHTPAGRVLGGAPILITGPPGFRVLINANADGAFSLTLPHGRYQFTVQRDGPAPGVTVVVTSAQTTRVELIVDVPLAGIPSPHIAARMFSANSAKGSP